MSRPLRLPLHVYRVVGHPSEAAWIECIHMHTAGSDSAKERALEYSPVFLADDAAKECGLPEEIIAAAAERCVLRGFTLRMGLKGDEAHRYRVDYDAIQQAEAKQ